MKKKLIRGGKYEVSDTGEVRSFARYPEGKTLKQTITKDNYRSVWVDGKAVKVHKLVLETFVGPCPQGMEALHHNGVPSDNRLSNLRWGTRKENRADRIRHGRDHNLNKTRCPEGHEYTPKNTIKRKDGGRGCRACARAAHERWLAANPEKFRESNRRWRESRVAA